MKRFVIAAALAVGLSFAFAETASGPDCLWLLRPARRGRHERRHVPLAGACNRATRPTIRPSPGW